MPHSKTILAGNNGPLFHAFHVGVLRRRERVHALGDAGPARSRLRRRFRQITWLVSSYAFAYALAAPVFGHLSDHGRRRPLLIALFLFALDGLGIALAPTFEIAVALRILGGLASAVIIPNAFALVSRTLAAPASCGDGRRHARHDGGITTGPAIAGVLTGWIGWRALSCWSRRALAAFLVRMAMPGSRPNGGDGSGRAAPLRWLRKPDIVRPCSPRDCGTDGCRRLSAVGRSPAPALCPGRGPGRTEHCRIRHRTRRGQSFRRRAATPGLRRECALVITNVLLVASVAAFYLPPLPLWGALACLAAWGSWGRRPLATTVLASRSDRDKGAAGGGETEQPVHFVVPPAGGDTARARKPTLAATVFLAGLGLGAVLTVHDAVRANRRSSLAGAKES